jgi:hypothetical protein
VAVPPFFCAANCITAKFQKRDRKINSNGIRGIRLQHKLLKFRMISSSAGAAARGQATDYQP